MTMPLRQYLDEYAAFTAAASDAERVAEQTRQILDHHPHGRRRPSPEIEARLQAHLEAVDPRLWGKGLADLHRGAGILRPDPVDLVAEIVAQHPDVDPRVRP